jgi:hypothetical protein
MLKIKLSAWKDSSGKQPIHWELEPIMGERPNSKPLSTNEMEEFSSSEDGDKFGMEDIAMEDIAMTTLDQSVSKTPGRHLPTHKDNTPSTLSNGSVNSAATKRLTAATAVKAKKKVKKQGEADSIVSALLGEGEGTREDFHALRVREVSAREQEANAREQEANARMIEANAISKKTKKETDLLAIDETVKLLRARKQMIDEGLCTAENIDEYLPMPNKDN